MSQDPKKLPGRPIESITSKAHAGKNSASLTKDGPAAFNKADAAKRGALGVDKIVPTSENPSA